MSAYIINGSASNSSSPLRGSGANASGGGGVSMGTTPSLILPPAGGGKRKKPFSKVAQQNAKRLRNNLTEAEKKLWYHLRNKQMGVKFRRQQPVGKYIVDFISFEAALIIELDGGQHGNQRSYDAVRDTFLKKEGFVVLRFWNNEVMENMEAVLAVITGQLKNSLLTSPLKGEELIVEGL